MKVKDLIYLLNSRCEEEDEVSMLMHSHDFNTDAHIGFEGYTDDHLGSVFRDDENETAIIKVTSTVIHNIVLAVYKKELTFEQVLSPEIMERFKS